MIDRASHIIDEAICAARHGFRVHPLHSSDNGRCSCSRGAACANAGKRPRLAGWQKLATTDPHQIKRWWMEFPDANAGIVTGKSSGIIVLDVDPRRGGLIGLDILDAQHGSLPETVQVMTGGGGWHYYFRHPGTHVPDSVDRLGPGLDVKADGAGDGSNVVLAGSHHPSGRTYEWEWSHHPDEMPLAQSPQWLLELNQQDIGSGTEQTESTETTFPHSAHSLCSVHSVPHAIRLTLPKREGQRHRCIFRFCCALKSIPGYADADARQLEDEFQQWWMQAKPIVRTKIRDESWLDFLHAWSNAGPLWGDPVVEALARARQAELPVCAQKYDCPHTITLVKLCRELQRSTAADRFYLSCRKVEEVTGMPRTTAWRRFQLLVFDGVLNVIERHTATHATRYRYLGEELDHASRGNAS